MKTFHAFICALVMSFTALAPIELQAVACATAEKVVVPEQTLVSDSLEFDTYPSLLFYVAVRAPPCQGALIQETACPDTADPSIVASFVTIFVVFHHSDFAGGSLARCASPETVVWWRIRPHLMLC